MIFGRVVCSGAKRRLLRWPPGGQFPNIKEVLARLILATTASFAALRVQRERIASSALVIVIVLVSLENLDAVVFEQSFWVDPDGLCGHDLFEGFRIGWKCPVGFQKPRGSRGVESVPEGVIPGREILKERSSLCAQREGREGPEAVAKD